MWSEERFLLGYNKDSSSTYSSNLGNPPRSSRNRNVSHERARRKETQKYLRESYYHRIKCTKITFLATFMWRKPLNSVTSVNATHKKPKRVYDGTGTQARVQMNDKCRIKMVQEGYITWKILHGKGEEKDCKQIYNRALSKKYLRISILRPIREHYSITSFYYLSLFSVKICFSVTWFTWAQFPNPLSTNLLFWAEVHTFIELET